MNYQYLATSVPGFIQQLAVAYIARGYVFYVAGHVPPGKNAVDIDRKLIELYGIDQSRWQRARRRVKGLANVHYLRFAGFWVLLANHGEHEFFQREATVIRDVRRTPIAFAGYSISVRRGIDGKSHVSVRIHQNEYKWLKSYMCEVAQYATLPEMEQEFRVLRFEPYAPIVRQLYAVLRTVNKRRKVCGLPQVDPQVIRVRRRVVRPFEDRPPFGSPPPAHPAIGTLSRLAVPAGVRQRRVPTRCHIVR